MISLVKTVSANKCKCGSEHFAKFGIGWSCTACGSYVPPKLEKNKTIESLKADIVKLQNLHGELKEMVTEVENLLKR